MLNNQHLSHLIQSQAEKYKDKVALTYRDYEQNAWLPITWRKFAAYVNAVSHSLLELGVAVQEKIGVFSQNKPESLYVDFGA